jgi:hypothetical protein
LYRQILCAAALILAIAASPAQAVPPGGPNPSRNGAKVKLSKRTVKPGGSMRVSGRRFPASKSATVKLDDDRVGIIAVFAINSKGRFSGTVTIPRNVLRILGPGKHWLRFLAPASRVNGQSNTSIKKTFRLKRR